MGGYSTGSGTIAGPSHAYLEHSLSALANALVDPRKAADEPILAADTRGGAERRIRSIRELAMDMLLTQWRCGILLLVTQMSMGW